MKKYFLFAALLLSGAALFTACEEDDDDNDTLVSGIPSDKDAKPNPEVDSEDVNTVLPNLNYSVSTEGKYAVIRLDMTGVRDPFTKDWLHLYGTGDSRQNLWIEVDDVPKGFSIINTADDKASQPDPALDVVFLVDNSTSMDEEADAIAADIIEWSKQLSNKKLDVRFGCVGYGGFVSGAINLTTAAELEKWLTQKDWLNDVNGVWRTRGFAGPDAARLQEKANLAPSNNESETFYRVVNTSYTYTSWGAPDRSECGVLALRYANDLFSFRPGANRVYVNLTDEPNQPSGYERFSTEWVKNNWTATQGTIHTVFTYSASLGDKDSYYYYETYYGIGKNYPWDLSVYTDGTMLFTDSDFKDAEGNLVKLSDLPVSGAMQNSYIIRFTNIENLFDNKTHVVHMTVKSNSTNGEVIADKRFNMVFER